MAEKFDHLEEHLEKFVENIRQLGIIVSDFQPSSQAGLNQKLNFIVTGLQDIDKCRQQLHDITVPLEVFEIRSSLFSEGPPFFTTSSPGRWGPPLSLTLLEASPQNQLCSLHLQSTAHYTSSTCLPDPPSWPDWHFADAGPRRLWAEVAPWDSIMSRKSPPWLSIPKGRAELQNSGVSGAPGPERPSQSGRKETPAVQLCVVPS
uniref:Mediator of RNA polymerase II transcription subunit 10 n=1 Tax=Felis catus TaxID=9685 RepID=A0ABI7Y721_FELCA